MKRGKLNRIMGVGMVGGLALALAAGTAFGDTLTVKPDGSGNFTTIQAAIDAAKTGTSSRSPRAFIPRMSASGISTARITKRTASP